MEEIKRLASDGDTTKADASGEEKRLASVVSKEGKKLLPEETGQRAAPPYHTKPTQPTQIETSTLKDRKDRIRKATKEGGIKKVPDNFNNKDGDWVVINSTDPFEVLYLDYEQYEAITSEIIANNYKLLSEFWDTKIDTSGKSRLCADYSEIWR